MTRPQPHARSDYPYTTPVPTRWSDNDLYGHVNNVVYYSYFDTVVNRYLIEEEALDLEQGEVIGLVVQTGCAFFQPAAFPEVLHAGLRVTHCGTSSVHYEIALFRAGDDSAAAQGHFVHVYVDRATRRPTPLPAALRAAVEKLRS